MDWCQDIPAVARWTRALLTGGILGALAVAMAGEVVSGQDVLVSSRNTHSIKRYDFASGAYLGDLVPPGSGGLSFPQEVLLHPDGFLLVTGRGQTAVKKYDAASGAYLGDFTAGYSLDNPTKTTLGPDGRLYVSQWGATQNAVARFDLATGAFVDEFTSIGIPNGTGHAWDTDGRLYVAQYGSGGNGRVLRFDTDGTFLDVFIASGPVRGPVNLWFDDAGHLIVVDWTLGDVLRFDGTTGALLGAVVATTTNLEGVALGPSGELYLCDWSGNQVFRYDAVNGLVPYLTTGGMVAPNSILLRDLDTSGLESPADGNPPDEPGNGADGGPGQGSALDPTSVRIHPNPASGSLRIDYTVREEGMVVIEVRDVVGRRVSMLRSTSMEPGSHFDLWDGTTAAGHRAPRGVYFVSVRTRDSSAHRQIVLR